MAVKIYPKGSREQLSKNFRAYEFDCPCPRCKETPISEELVKGVQAIRDILGVPITINGYRCPEHNAEVSNSSKTSRHMQGRAADIKAKGKSPDEVAKTAETVGFKGIGLYNTAKDGHFVHVDDRENKYFWFGHAQQKRTTFGGATPAKAEKTCTVKLPVLSKGSQGNGVEALQIMLNGRGYNCGEVDGAFGGDTENALRRYQADSKITADGKVGQKTWSKLIGT